MIGRITIDELARKAHQLASELEPINLEPGQQDGFRYIIENVRNGGLSVGVGPPGTGKTVVFTNVYSHIIEDLDKDEVIVHIAPTNKLVEETCIKTLSLLLLKGYDEKALMDLVRMYGSRFVPKPLNENVKIIFTTGYQPGALIRLSQLKNVVHLMIDEASTTAFHEAFIPLSISLANEIKKENVEFIGSFNVIGDPMQAIVESTGTRWKFEQLIVYRMIMSIIPKDQREEVRRDPSKMFELAKQYLAQSEIKYFFLDVTHRMPEPTEKLVSIPFYDSKLRASRKYSDAMKNILVEHSNLSPFIQDTEILRKVKDTIDNALDSQIPVVYIKDKGLAYSPKAGRSIPELDEYDKIRSIVGSEIASYIALRTNVRRVMFIAPYNEITQQARLYTHSRFARHLGERLYCLSFSTVHSVLGSEADIIVAVLGKEYIGERFKTIYFQMPELLNVQFSRHQRVIVIVGNIEKLAENMKRRENYEYVSRITEAIQFLRNKDLIKEYELRLNP